MKGPVKSLHRNACAAHAGSRPHGAVGLCFLSILIAFVAGCEGGLAPVRSPSEPAIPGRDREHLVGEGDTVYAIAWRHGVDYRVLARFNSIGDPYTIYPGQRLLIPGPGDVVPPEPEPAAATKGTAAPEVDVAVYAADTETAPVIEPLPQPKPVPIPIVTAPVRILPKGTAVRANTAPEVTALTASPVPKAASKPPAKPPGATRVAAGLRWTRPTDGEAIGKFGRSGNKGLDIAGTFEQPIRAASNGMVVYAGSGLVGYGKLLIVKHNSQILSAYAHNERLHVKEGDEVRGGQHIADMGRSGKGRTMLHFEIRRDGKPVDPLRFLP